MDPEDRKAFLKVQVQHGIEMRAWWIGEMLATPSPLTERMTLFWHNHFATSQQKVKANQLMYRQNVLLRQYALGNFGTLLHAVAKDPAMLIYLDGATSRKGEPNENFAREVMELFTLGEGHYEEHDIKEAARAFTGWSIDPNNGQFLFRHLLHDNGTKSILGQTGNFDGDAVLDILLRQPATAEFITRKLWREFISPVPDERLVRDFAAVFRANRYEVKPLLRAMLTSDAFYAQANRGTLVKSPVELVVGTLGAFDFRPDDLRPAAVMVAFLGQNLFSPPNVKGWPGGEEWINSATLLGRKRFLDLLFGVGTDGSLLPTSEQNRSDQARGEDSRAAKLASLAQSAMAGWRFDSERWTAQFPPGMASRNAARLVLAIASEHASEKDVDSMKLVRSLVFDPAYQVK
jgi:uncharacterized protein (DUF1800 family)